MPADDGYMTPKEAEKNYCPFTRDTKGEGASCISDSCMGWRWQHSLTKLGDTQTISKKRGYCGAFGSP